MGKTLLLADDSVTIQKVVGISFASEDISLVTVDNGDDAIARARALRPDVILADVVMPGKSGYEVCEAINADPALRHIPVLLLTGTFEAFDAERASRAGAAGHISKPFEAQALVERVKRLLANAPAPAPVRPPAPAPAAAHAPIGAPAASPRAPLAASAPAAPRAPMATERDDAFDFLDESPPARPARSATAESKLTDPQLSDQGLDFDGGDSAFAFGDDDFASTSGTSSQSSATAHTVAILPDAPSGSDDFALGGDSELELAPPSRAARPETLAARPVEEADFDYEFESAGGTARHAGVEPSATVLEPIAGSEYDVSSSDLGSTLPPDATRLLEPASAPIARLGEDPVMDLLEGDLDEDEAPLSADPAEETFDRLPKSGPSAAAHAARTVVQLAPEPTVRAQAGGSDFDASWGAAPSQPAAPRSAARPTPGGASIADSALERIAPALRAQLHETLEKIAWEAFGRAAETIIEQAVERLEKAAWEVVPRLAETLIVEEIRRLKDESEEA